MNDAEQFIYRHMKVGRRIEGFAGVDYREYPQEAVRKAIVNAKKPEKIRVDLRPITLLKRRGKKWTLEPDRLSLKQNPQCGRYRKER